MSYGAEPWRETLEQNRNSELIELFHLNTEDGNHSGINQTVTIRKPYTVKPVKTATQK